MHPSLDVREFYNLNYRQFDRFLQWRGLAEAADRSDVVQTFILDIMEKDTLKRADSCCNTEAQFTNYMAKTLQNHYMAWLRQEHHWTGTPADFTNSNCFSDSTAVPFNNLTIGEFQDWSRDHRVDKSIKEQLAGYCNNSSSYRYFQKFRNRYREWIKSFAY
jgi:hypothetical protein